MPIIIDIRKDMRFKEGRKLGKKEGRKKGRKEMSLLKDQNIVIHMLQKGIIPIETIAEFADVTLDFVAKTKAGYLKTLYLLEKDKKTMTEISEKTGLMLDLVEKLKKNVNK